MKQTGLSWSCYLLCARRAGVYSVLPTPHVRLRSQIPPAIELIDDSIDHDGHLGAIRRVQGAQKATPAITSILICFNIVLLAGLRFSRYRGDYYESYDQRLDYHNDIIAWY